MAKKRRVQVVVAVALCGSVLYAHAHARMSSSNYQINADVISSGGSLGTSTNYTLNDTVGEDVVGTGSSTTYILKDGFWHMVNTYVQFSVDSSVVDFGTLTPGTPVTGQNVLSVTTDAWNGYTLSIHKDHRLRHTNGSDEIADHAGTIATPLAWSAPNTLGLGFSVAAGTNVEATWGSGTKYAAVPTGSATVFHTKTGYRSPADTTTLTYKLDVPSTQRSGHYTNTVTYTVMPAL